MQNMQIAKSDDIPAIVELLRKSDLPITDIPKENQVFYILKSAHEIQAVSCIEEFEDVGVFRSFAVNNSQREKGLGTILYKQVLESVVKKGTIKALYLLTTTAAAYFRRLGWIHIQRNSVPGKIEKSDEFASICPSSADCMCLTLQEGPIKEAISTFNLGFNCSQSVLTSYTSSLGIDKSSALKLATGFGGGINGRGELCGAVSGAYMVLSLKYGRSEVEDIDAKKRTSTMISEFDKRFIAKNKSLNCRKLLNADISKSEELEILKENKAFEIICPRLVKDAVEILEDLIDESTSKL